MLKRKNKKIKVLCYFDSPTVNTGFGVLSRNLLNQLQKTGKYEFDVIGINYYGDYYDKEKMPYNIIPAMKVGESDLFGRERLMYTLCGATPGFRKPYDILFTIQDPFILSANNFGSVIPKIQEAMATPDAGLQIGSLTVGFPGIIPPFKWISYWPIDGRLKENWVTQGISHSNFPVAYTQFGKKQIQVWDKGKDIQVIPHGVDLNIFKPLSRQERRKFRQEFFKGQVENDEILVSNISRNQPRKDIPRTMQIIAEFKKLYPDTKIKLYLHMKHDDVGGNIHEYARFLGLEENKDYIVPASFNEAEGVNVETLNKIYNATDVLLTTTLGEGWGFILTEGMATKTLILAPNNSSITEILNLNTEDLSDFSQTRGFGYKSGSSPTEYYAPGVNDHEQFRPIGNIEDAVKKLAYIIENPKEVREIVERAYVWVQTLSWENVGKMWDNIFAKASELDLTTTFQNDATKNTTNNSESLQSSQPANSGSSRSPRTGE